MAKKITITETQENLLHPKVDWESEFALLMRYCERLEVVNDQLIKQQAALTALVEKLAGKNGNN